MVYVEEGDTQRCEVPARPSRVSLLGVQRQRTGTGLSD